MLIAGRLVEAVVTVPDTARLLCSSNRSKHLAIPAADWSCFSAACSSVEDGDAWQAQSITWSGTQSGTQSRTQYRESTPHPSRFLQTLSQQPAMGEITLSLYVCIVTVLCLKEDNFLFCKLIFLHILHVNYNFIPIQHCT